MNWHKASLFVRGYSFLARNRAAGMVIDKTLDLFAWLDYRILILLTMWHPDMGHRIKYLRRRGVQVGEHVFLDFGVFIEITAPRSVVIEDYAAVGYGCMVYAHDALLNAVADLPVRIRTTRLGYNCVVGVGSTILSGVTVGRHSLVAPGSLVTKDVPDGTVVAGRPARHLMTCEELVLSWQEDMKAHPEVYYDTPHPNRAPSTPFDSAIAWRREGVGIRHWTEIRTGTPFDHILDYKAMRTRGE